MRARELSEDQQRERDRIEKKWGGPQKAEEYYGHLHQILANARENIQAGRRSELSEQQILDRMQALGLPIDLVGYEIGHPFEDLRE